MKKITLTNKVFQQTIATEQQFKYYTFEANVSDGLYNQLKSQADKEDHTTIIPFDKGNDEVVTLFAQAQKACGDSDDQADKDMGYPWYQLSAEFTEV